MLKITDPDKNVGVPVRHLNQKELADRWSISPRSLERCRWQRKGPRFIKIGGRVVYRIEDIEAYESNQLRASTAESSDSVA